MAENPLDLGKQEKDIADAANVSVDAVAKLGTFGNTFGNATKNGLWLIGDNWPTTASNALSNFSTRWKKDLRQKA